MVLLQVALPRATVSAAETPTVRLALAGNPNCGKTSLFNALTGARQHVANYPGVTVERRAGRYTLGDARFEVVDLPGTYSLASYSPEERIARDELLSGQHDVVVVVADAGNLKRSLVMLAQVMQTGARVVLCLNMMDEARNAGLVLDLPAMARRLGMPVVGTVGTRGEGVDTLREAIRDAAKQAPVDPDRVVLGDRLDETLSAIGAPLAGTSLDGPARAWIATRLLVEDTSIAVRVEAAGAAGRAALDEAARQRARLESETGMDAALFVTTRYFGFVEGLIREVTAHPAAVDARALSARIDAVVAHRVLGLPIFAAVMYAIFWLTFTVGEIPMGWIERGFEALGSAVGGLWAPGADSALRSLLVDGVIAGVGGVVVFLPNILLLFLGLALLEDSGYMARAAFLMDRVMHRFGLHGRSFMPMMTGFGCSIPGIMATRTLEHERDRLTAMMVLPLFSCGARVPIWLLLIPAFFPPAWHAPMLWLIYALGIALAMGMALLLRRTLLRGADAPFVMELPPYRRPTFGALARKMAERGWLYVRKAGTVILAISVVMWFISSHPKKDLYDVDAQVASGTSTLSAEELDAHRAAEDLAHSVAGRLGQAIEPVLAPLGFDWKMSTALIGAFAAKEVFVSQMGIVYAIGEIDETSLPLRDTLRRDYSPLTGFSLMIFLLIATPCMATFAVTRRESNSWRWPLLQFGGLTALAWLLSFAVFQLGRLVL